MSSRLFTRHFPYSDTEPRPKKTHGPVSRRGLTISPRTHPRTPKRPLAALPAAIPSTQRTTLPNGLRILTAAMPHTHSVSLSLYVGAGSRYERDQEAGVSHFVEHLLFKGTEKLPTAKDVAEAIDGVGGVLNGGTDREYTVYYIKVARPTWTSPWTCSSSWFATL